MISRTRMPPKTNYGAAARRHHAGAMVMVEGHPPIADHLLGVAAECALKAIAVHLGAPVKPSGDLKGIPQGKGHLPAYLSEFCSINNNPYVQHLPQNIFDDWNVADRYSDGSHIDQACVRRHLQHTQKVFEALQIALEQIA